MDELQSENEKPLLVVKYVWWKILWKLFFPISIVLFFGIGMANMFFLDIQLECKEQSCIFIYMMLIFWLLMIFIGIFLTLMTILFREIRIYSDRLEQKWYIFGKRIIYYRNAYLITSHSPPIASFILIKPIEKFHLIYCYMDESLLSKSDREKVLSILSEISNRNIIDFKNKGKTTFNPFIKK